MKLSQFLAEENIRQGLEGQSKRELFREALALLHQRGAVTDPERVLADLELRESIMSTGNGQGVAIPHAQSEGVSEMHLSLWWPARPLDFEALDGRPVDLVFMILGPRDAGSDHVKLLSKISRLLHQEDFRERIRTAPGPREALELIREFDEH